MDRGAGHLAIIVGTGGGAFANENCRLGQAFDHFINCPGICLGGMLAPGIESHIIIILYQVFICSTLPVLLPLVIGQSEVHNLLRCCCLCSCKA